MGGRYICVCVCLSEGVARACSSLPLVDALHLNMSTLCHTTPYRITPAAAAVALLAVDTPPLIATPNPPAGHPPCTLASLLVQRPQPHQNLLLRHFARRQAPVCIVVIGECVFLCTRACHVSCVMCHVCLLCVQFWWRYQQCDGRRAHTYAQMQSPPSRLSLPSLHSKLPLLLALFLL